MTLHFRFCSSTMRPPEFASYEEIMGFVDQSRPRALTEEGRLDILRMHAYYRREGIPQVSAHIAAILGRSIKLVQEVWTKLVATRTVVAAPTPCNQSVHHTRVPETKPVLELVHNFVRSKRITRTRVVAKDIMALLAERGHVQVDMNNERDAGACLRAIQGYLVRKGFRRGSPSSSVAFSLTPHVLLARDNYVKYMITELESSQPRPVVYMDESFIHHHYTRAKDSIYHPSDSPGDAPKAKHKGQRLCFIAGILSDGPDESHVLGLDIFKGGKRQPKDYHGMFDHAYFIKWFECLLNQIKALGKENAIIIMDNASYHKGLPLETPKGTWTKARLLEACGGYGIAASDSEYKTEIW